MWEGEGGEIGERERKNWGEGRRFGKGGGNWGKEKKIEETEKFGGEKIWGERKKIGEEAEKIWGGEERRGAGGGAGGEGGAAPPLRRGPAAARHCGAPCWLTAAPPGALRDRDRERGRCGGLTAAAKKPRTGDSASPGDKEGLLPGGSGVSPLWCSPGGGAVPLPHPVRDTSTRGSPSLGASRAAGHQRAAPTRPLITLHQHEGRNTLVLNRNAPKLCPALAPSQRAARAGEVGQCHALPEHPTPEFEENSWRSVAGVALRQTLPQDSPAARLHGPGTGSAARTELVRNSAFLKAFAELSW